jgi:hypothetical protein
VEVGLHDPEALPPAERARAVALSEKLAPVGAKAGVYAILARALALTRAGQWGKAQEYLALARGDKGKVAQARTDAQLAMIRRLQGRAAEARRLADKAAVELATHESGGLTSEWIGAIFLRRLVHEARRPLPLPVP